MFYSFSEHAARKTFGIENAYTFEYTWSVMHTHKSGFFLGGGSVKAMQGSDC